MTARVFVNRVWGYLMGDYLVATPSDFGLQGVVPVHPELLDWLALDFISHNWSVKHLVRQIVLSETFAQSSGHRDAMAAIDSENRYYWRVNRKHFSIEMLRDRLLACSGQLDLTARGRPGELWDDDYTRRRTIYGYINRFNLDPTLRAFDFPSRMQTHGTRDESIVASQALFTMNAPFVWDQAVTLVKSADFHRCKDDLERIQFLFLSILLREPQATEVESVGQFVAFQKQFEEKQSRFHEDPWPMVAQSLMMTNEFQYLD